MHGMTNTETPGILDVLEIHKDSTHVCEQGKNAGLSLP